MIKLLLGSVQTPPLGGSTRNECYIFQNLLHFQAKLCLVSHQDKLHIIPAKTMKQFQIYQDAMGSRFWSSFFIAEANEARDNFFIVEGKLESNTCWSLNTWPPPEAANRGRLCENDMKWANDSILDKSRLSILHSLAKPPPTCDSFFIDMKCWKAKPQ